MEDKKKEAPLARINRIIWVVMLAITFGVVITVIVAMFWQGAGY